MTITQRDPWAVTQDKVDAAVRRIVQIADPSRLFLFGSFVRENTNRNSDLDVLVVTKNDISNARKESVRIRKGLKGISMPMDILVISERRLADLANAPGLIYGEILKSGKLVYDAAA